MQISYEIEKELKRAIFKKSFYEFFKWAFNILEPQTKLEDTFHIKYLCDILQAEHERIIARKKKRRDIIINIPPRTSKSKIVSQALLPWIWISAPHIKMITVSFDDKLTLSNAQYSKDIIKSDEYQELFGDIYQIRRDLDAKERFGNTKGGERISVTTGSNITGFGAEWVLVDDPQNPKTSEQEVERLKVIDYWKHSLYNRCTPLDLGVRVLVQQRLHFEDLSGHLLDKLREEFLHICLPAELSNDVRPAELKRKYKDGLLDPVRLGRTEIEKLKKQGARYYAGQYLQIPSPEEGGIIKKDWFEVIDPQTLVRDTINEPIHFIIDSAYTKDTENDPTAILVCFKKNNNIYILDVVEVWLEFHELVQFITTYTSKFQYNRNSKVVIEPKASGKDIVSQLRATTKLNVIETAPPDKDKITRVHSITATLQGMRVKLVKGGYIEAFLAQLTAFPNGKHDDMVDTLYHAVNEFLHKDTPDFFFI